jgi:adenylyltransferase/sulfurtransferase
METSDQNKIELLQNRIKYLENLLDTNKISYSKDATAPLAVPPKMTENEIVNRYGRQMLIPDFGRKGQEKIQNARVLIIGCGGIGAPAAYYLAAAGIGKLGLVDGDKVEESNLHRQIIHSTSKLGMNKAISAKMALQDLNKYIKVETFETHITTANANDIVKDYDIVLDATDNASARYLINDTCIINKKTLVSGSALRWEGQLTIYGLTDGPCYRCLFPECPKPSMMMSCNEGGVIGIIPGLVGMLEALEALKILLGQGEIFHKRMFIYDGLNNVFKTYKIRGKQDTCIVCGKTPTLTDVANYDYEDFVGLKQCGATGPTQIPAENNIKWKDFMSIYNDPKFSQDAILIDVRSKEMYDVVNLDNAISLPLGTMTGLSKEDLVKYNVQENKKVYVMCKRGIASKSATNHLLKLGFKDVFNIEGGFTSYNKEIDPNTPVI